MSAFVPRTLSLRSAVLFLATALLSGCASLLGPQPTEPASEAQLAAWESHATQLEAMNDWAFDGRAAVRSGMTGGSVQLDWTQVGTVTSLALSGPFDSGRLAMTGTPTHMLLTDGHGNRRETDNPVALLEEQTGWRIPLATLPRWVRGLPSDSLDTLAPGDYRLDDQGRLAALSENDWQIEYDRYRDLGRATLPQFIELRHDGMRIRIAIDTWDIGQPVGQPGQ